MAYVKLVDTMTLGTDFRLLAAEINTFLAANGWVLEHWHSTTDTDWELAMSKGGITFSLRPSTTTNIIFEVGTSWSGTAIVNTCSFSVPNELLATSVTILKAPTTVWLIANGNTFYMVAPTVSLDNTNQATFLGCGYLNKFGTYNSGIFRLLSQRYLPTSGPNATYNYNAVMTGDFGVVGSAPNMWCNGNEGNWEVTTPLYNASQDSVGLTNTSTMATPMLPVYSIVRNDNIDLRHIAGTYPDILSLFSRGVHFSGDIIDHQGSQWLMFGSYANTLSRLDCVCHAFRLD